MTGSTGIGTGTETGTGTRNMKRRKNNQSPGPLCYQGKRLLEFRLDILLGIVLAADRELGPRWSGWRRSLLSSTL